MKAINHIFLCFSLVLTWAYPGTAQVKKELQINDVLPDTEIQGLLQPGSLKTNQLYQKGFLIINFWATWCKPCVKEMQLLARQAELHQGKIQVLFVAYEPKAQVQAFLDKHPEFKHSALHFISDDTEFCNLFFHQALPHNVWVNDAGVIKAITSGEEITEDNLANFLKNSNNQMRIKTEVPFDWNKPAHVPDSLLEYRSLFMKNLPGVEMSGNVIANSKLPYPNMNRFFCFNSLITQLFWHAYQMPGEIRKKTLLEVKTTDSARYFWPGSAVSPGTYKGISLTEWCRENWYTYELRTPQKTPDSRFFPQVIRDLEFNLGVKSWKENRRIECAVVTYRKPASIGDIFKQSDKPYYLGIVKDQLILKNIPIDHLLDWLSKVLSDKPLRIEPYLNKTGLSKPITATVDLGPDPQAYYRQEHLEKCFSEQLGFHFKVKKARYPILMISDL